MEIKKLELLAPAKDIECGMAAINCGADAVYIGAPKFGARAAVGNTLEDIETLINYAHKFYAKVYVTVNTLIYENELDDVQKLITALYNIGADAIIIQDMGILEMNLPPVPLFASTQTHNYDVERVKFLENAGIQRVILARELSLERIKEIKANTNVKLEFFIHGALCVCMSGQCYFSYATTGRSANRGECSQPCRMLYSLEDSGGNIIAENKYLLSLKDLNLSAHLRDLTDAGITSFKIEGRLKDSGYVKNITAFYRQKLDEIIESDATLEKASSGKIFYSFIPDPDRTFNRGYTEHFISGEGKDVASINTQKATGKLIGKVIKTYPDYFEIDTDEIISAGDGLCYFDQNNLLTGMSVHKTAEHKIFTDKTEGLVKGTDIYRNKDHQFIKELSKEETKRKIRADFSLFEKDGGVFISAFDEDGNKISYKADIELTPATNPEMMKSNLIKQLNKAGDSIFYISKINLELEQVYFFSIGFINSLRRNALDLLEQERLKNYPRQIKETGFVDKKTGTEKSLSYLMNVTNSKAAEFYKKHGAEIIEPGFELLEETNDKMIMRTKYCIKSQLNMCPFEEDSIKIKGIKEPLYLNDGRRKYKLEFRCTECEMIVKL